MDTNKNNNLDSVDTNKNNNLDAEEIMQSYEELFGELPQLPIMGNYGSILIQMQEAIIRKQPLTPEEIAEAFEGRALDQGR